jgi:prepilin-type N-terminal cleavage/methylation domain-containing protein
MTPRSSPRRSLRSRGAAGARGFTLIELMVAILAGMMVAFGAFAFAKSASRSFQQESRLATATGNATNGFRRLLGDVQRVAFLSTPNIMREQREGNGVCLLADGAFPDGIRQLAGLRLEKGGTYSRTESPAAPFTNILAANGLSPDRITIAGAFDSSEQFYIAGLVVNGTTVTATIQPNSGAIARTLNGNPANAAPFTNAFRANRIARIVDAQGFQHFGVISASAVSAAGVATVTMSNAAPLWTNPDAAAPASANPTCSALKYCNGCVLNVVNRIQYEIRPARTVSNFADLYAAPAGAPLPEDDQGRTELVRTELDHLNAVIEGTEEVVAEYAVDLKFGATVDTSIFNPAEPKHALANYEIGASQVYTQTAAPGIAATGPERVRSLRVRLAVRSREADRTSTITGPTLPVTSGSAGLYRFKVKEGEERYARVRTLQSEVALVNQAWVFW